MTGELPLARLTRAELEFLRKAIARRQVPTPLSEEGLDAIGKGKLFARLGPLAGAGQEVALALIDLALASGGAGTAASARPATLVWTGPEVKLSSARATTAVLLELLGAARERVLVVGYEFDHGAVIFAPLHKAMRERGVKATIHLDVRPAPSSRTAMDAYLALRTHQFLKRNWPFGEPLPELYHFPAGCEHGSRASLHAKCAVVDGRHVLVGSANFTRRGHSRNVEVGVYLEDAGIAEALTRQFEYLAESGSLEPLPALAARRAEPPVATEDDDDAGPEPGEAAAYETLAQELLVSETARPLFVRLLEAGVPVPEVGEDVEGEAGEVLGSPELSWEALRVAVLLPEQEGSRKKLEAAGWECFPVALGDDEFGALCALLGREA